MWYSGFYVVVTAGYVALTLIYVAVMLALVLVIAFYVVLEIYVVATAGYVALTLTYVGYNPFHPSSKLLESIITEKVPHYIGGGFIKWNFTKFLLDRNGNVLHALSPLRTRSLWKKILKHCYNKLFYIEKRAWTFPSSLFLSALDELVTRL